MFGVLVECCILHIKLCFGVEVESCILHIKLCSVESCNLDIKQCSEYNSMAVFCT